MSKCCNTFEVAQRNVVHQHAPAKRVNMLCVLSSGKCSISVIKYQRNKNVCAIKPKQPNIVLISMENSTMLVMYTFADPPSCQTIKAFF